MTTNFVEMQVEDSDAVIVVKEDGSVSVLLPESCGEDSDAPVPPHAAMAAAFAMGMQLEEVVTFVWDHTLGVELDED